MTDAGAPRIRLDKWLFHARFIKHRKLAADLVRRRRIRVNTQLATKVHGMLRPGDMLTLVQPQGVVAIRVVSLGTRRGPPGEAATLYEVVEQIR